MKRFFLLGLLFLTALSMRAQVSYRYLWAGKDVLSGLCLPVKELSPLWSLDALTAMDSQGSKVWGGGGLSYHWSNPFKAPVTVHGTLGVISTDGRLTNICIGAGISF